MGRPFAMMGARTSRYVVAFCLTASQLDRSRAIFKTSNLPLDSFRGLASDGFRGGNSESVCPLSLRNSEPTRGFSLIKIMTPNEHPRRHHHADGPLSPLCATSSILSSFGAASVMMCWCARPASSSAPSATRGLECS